MEQEELMPVNEFCIHYNAEFSFIHSLHEHGLIEITYIEQAQFLPKEQLPLLEKFIRMHYEMDINMEGIEAIQHLLERVHKLQHEINTLKNNLQY